MHTALGMESRKRALEGRGAKQGTVPGEGKVGWQGSLGKEGGKSSWGAVWKHREGILDEASPASQNMGA